MRAFIGIPLPGDIRACLERLQRELAASGADVKWVAPDHWHVTLKFLDEMSHEQRHAVEALLARLVRREAPFQIRLEGLGAFPSMQAPRVVWVGITQGNEALARLAGAIDREGAALDLRAEARAFSPHLTLGRVRSPRGRAALARQLETTAWPAPAAWRVASLVLYQSVLSPEGPHYTALADIPLRGPLRALKEI